MLMGLRKDESWDDYVGKDVYVSNDYGQSGYLAHFINHSKNKVTVREYETNEERIIHEDEVYGLWILQDW